MRFRSYTVWVALIGCCILGLATRGAAASPTLPSFDCTKATAPIERMICADAELSRLDGEMGRLYFARRNAALGEARKQEVERQKEWLDYRFDLCELQRRGPIAAEKALQVRPCLIGLYERRIAQLEIVAANAPPPASIAGAWLFVTSGGEMIVEQRERDLYSVEIETVTGPTFHTCSVSIADAELNNGVIAARVEEQDYSANPPRPGICEIRIRFTGERAKVDSSGAVCRSFCGARGIFDGDYKRRK